MTKRANETGPGPAASLDALLAQRTELKRRDPEAILLFRVEDEHGDFYRAYAEDADALRHEIQLPIPYWAWDVHEHGVHAIGISPGLLEKSLARIVAAGRRAAVCEQVKGLVSGPGGEPVERIIVTGDPSRPPAPRAQKECPHCAGVMVRANRDWWECPHCRNTELARLSAAMTAPFDVLPPPPAGAEIERVATEGRIEDDDPPLGEWLREGTTVYALEEYRDSRGRTQVRNRWAAQVSGGPETPKEEVEAITSQIQATPKLLAACKKALDYVPSCEWDETLRAAAAFVRETEGRES